MGKKKVSSYALMARADALAEALVELGYKPTTVDSSYVIASGKSVYLWCDFRYDHVCFGKADTFDRWANSRDYIFEGIHEDKDDLAIVLRIAEDCAAKGMTRDEDTFEPIVLNQWWRQYKRDVRLEERVEAADDAASETPIPGFG